LIFIKVLEMNQLNMPMTGPIVDPMAIDESMDLSQWKYQLQQVVRELDQLKILPTQNLSLKLLRDQYGDSARALLSVADTWYSAIDPIQRHRAFMLMQQKYAALNSLWLQILALSGKMMAK
jgi:hypothetical protein